ncbi:NACHT domain-containing NTPase [Rhizobium leguminosarum]|uniref:NACHT domain-containing protein n=1 Tax=Rhizobium leguminosarum TaxID=384 RepID=UPI003F96E49A
MSTNSRDSGSALREKIASLLKCIYSEVEVEKSLPITTADVFYVDDSNQLFSRKVAVECKDWKKGLTSADIASIYNLYKVALDNGDIDDLLIIGEKELSQQPSRSLSGIKNVAYASFERFVFSLMNFSYLMQDNIAAYRNHPSSKNFIHTKVKGSDATLEYAALEWLSSSENVLLTYGGYGVGKTSFSLYFCNVMTEKYRSGEFARIPIRITLGDLFAKQDLKGVICSALSGADGRAAVRNFSYNLFLQMNREGYFLLILDGFDEMRHAMSIDDFKFTFEDMAILFEGKSKTMVLGRPDSFFSSEEENEVIDAILSSVLGNVRLLKKIEVDLLSRDQVETYLNNFLANKYSDPNIDRLRQLADHVLVAELDVLTRPVQLNMFTSIMGAFASPDAIFSRYDLYFQFIYRFVVREQSKSSRQLSSGISVEGAGYSDPRTIFMQNLAWWLLTDRKENRFKAHEVPVAFIPQSLRSARGTDAALREIIVGSVIEHSSEQRNSVLGTKGPKIYYFPHKSYVEFLVAEYFCRETFDVEKYVKFFAHANSEILSFIAEGPPEAVANLRSGLEHAKGTISQQVLSIAARDPKINAESVILAEGNTTPGRMFVYYRHLVDTHRSAEEIEMFLFNAFSKANSVNRLAAAYALAADYLGRNRSDVLISRLLVIALNKIGLFKLREMLNGPDGAPIYSVDAIVIHIVFISSCVSVSRGEATIDVREMKRFARDACQKGLYASGFDSPPAKQYKTHKLKMGHLRGLSAEIQPLVAGLTLKERTDFKSKLYGAAQDALGDSSNPFGRLELARNPIKQGK